jgi:hypothetical protein
MASSPLLMAFWMFLVPLIAVLLPIWIGQRYGAYIKKTGREIQEAPVGSVVAGSLGLLAFILGLTFEIVGNRLDKRKELMLNEASDIRTSYLCAGLVPEPYKSRARKMIVEYVDIRIELIKETSSSTAVIARSQQILDSLWSYSEALAAQDRSSEAYSLFISSISRNVALFNERIAVTFQLRLPKAILLVLCLVAFFSMTMLGYYFGITTKLSVPLSLGLAMTFAAVMWLIFALDRPEAGLIKLSQEPFITLQQQLHR